MKYLVCLYWPSSGAKRTTSILVLYFCFWYFWEPNGTTKNCLVHYVCRIFWEANKTTKIVLYTLGFWHFREPNGTTKTCLIYLFFLGGWGESTNFEAWVQVMKDSTWNKETRSKMGCECTLSVVCFHNKLTLIQSHLKFMSQTCCSKEGCWNSDILSGILLYQFDKTILFFIFIFFALSSYHELTWQFVTFVLEVSKRKLKTHSIKFVGLWSILRRFFFFFFFSYSFSSVFCLVAKDENLRIFPK